MPKKWDRANLGEESSNLFVFEVRNVVIVCVVLCLVGERKRKLHLTQRHTIYVHRSTPFSRDVIIIISAKHRNGIGAALRGSWYSTAHVTRSSSTPSMDRRHIRHSWPSHVSEGGKHTQLLHQLLYRSVTMQKIDDKSEQQLSINKQQTTVNNEKDLSSLP